MLKSSLTLRERVLSIDPAFTNIRGAFRGTVSVVLSFFAISIFAKAFHQPPTIAFFGVIIALMGAMTVNDPTRHKQMGTMALLPIPASIALIVSIVLGSWPILRISGFLIVVFLAVWVRKFGLRWLGFGMTLFMAYFAPLFFQIHFESIPWVVVAVIIATAISFLVRFFIFPDRVKTQLALFLESFEIQGKLLLVGMCEHLRGAGRAGASQINESSREQVRKEIRLFNDISLQLDQFLGTNAVGTPQEVIQLQVAEQGIALNQVVEEVRILLSQQNLSAKDFFAIADHLESIQSAAYLGKGRRVSPPQVNIGKLNPDARFDSLVMSGQRFLETFERPLWNEEALAKAASNIETKSLLSSNATHEATTGLSVNARQAIQACLATGLASAAGLSLSPERWYWASIAAFTVFVGASRGETVARAFLRTLGTAGGLLCGLVLAYFLAGHSSLEWSLIVASVFFALFGARLAFGFWAASAFSLMIALLFDIMGVLTTQILILRLEETLIGSIIGAIVGATILPTSTTTQIRKAVAKILRLAALSLESWSQANPDFATRRSLIKQLRQLDQELKTLRMTAAPIVGSANPLNRGRVPGVLQDLSMLRHYLNHLVASREGLQEKQIEILQAQAADLATQMRANAEALIASGSKPWQLTKPIEVKLGEGHFDDSSETSETLPGHWISRVRQTLNSLQDRKF